MDEAPRQHLALGPIEVSFRRRGEDEVRRLGLPGSVVVHVVILVVWLLVAPYRQTPKEKDAMIAAEPPVPVTFAEPFPPAPQAPPTPKLRPTPPPQPAPKPLRMQPPPEESIAALKPPAETKRDATRDAGRDDTRPAGGLSGGPLPTPTPGVPEIETDGLAQDAPRDVASNAEPPKDLQGRLRDFRRALEGVEPGAKGPKGGGTGSGGLTMPDVPATGMGIGNLEFESRDYDWSSYYRSIYFVIWRAWHSRLLSTSGSFERWAAERNRYLIDARARIVFTIERSGKVTGVAVQTPSGCYPFDDSAADALREVLLPPLPSDFPRESERVHATFIGEDIDIRGMRTHLQQLRNMGLF